MLRRPTCLSAILLSLATGLLYAQEALYAQESQTPAPAENPEIRNLLADRRRLQPRRCQNAGGLLDRRRRIRRPPGPAGRGGRGDPARVPNYPRDRQGCEAYAPGEGLRMLGDNAALVDALLEVTPAPAGRTGEPAAALALVKQEGRWRIDSLRETAGPAPPAAEALNEVELLVGEWSMRIPRTRASPCTARAPGRQTGHS